MIWPWLFLVPVALGAVYLFSGWAYQDAYERAERLDMEYAQAHPDCTLEEAHRHRDRVNRLFLR